jgi:hypothetical protein
MTQSLSKSPGCAENHIPIKTRISKTIIPVIKIGAAPLLLAMSFSFTNKGLGRLLDN